ncbi:MAG: hypothetical protein QM831_31925 [Kofleriaceae bacterium]
MIRYAVPALALAACATEPTTTTDTEDLSLAFHREHVTGDVYHYSLVLPIGQLHRVVRELAPFVPRPTAHAAMLLHGDFSTFTTNFLPGMAPYLAQHDIDVWGLDRRWTLVTDDNVSTLGTMGLTQEMSDVHAALVLARAARGGDKLALVGFSHGAELAYAYAATDGREIDALVPLDFFGAYSPADADLKAATCANAEAEYGFVADGTVDSPNDFFIDAGELDASAPNDPSPLIDGMTNREVVLLLLGQTYLIAPITATYQLLATNDDGTFAHVSETTADAWISDAPPHESMLEAADFDQRLCDGMPLANIRQPLLYIGAADAVGDHGLYATTQVRSTDVTTFVVPSYGHGDLLFASDAARRVWQPLAAWLAHH